MLYLYNTQMGLGVTYMALARTLAYGLRTEHFSELGIRTESGDVHHWYRRVSETTYRLVALMNPRPTPLRKILDAEQFEDLLQRMALPSAKNLADRNQNRLDAFCGLLVEASLRLLPTEVWQRYKGNIAIDATKVPIRGQRNSAGQTGSRSNPDPLAGRYMRAGSHGGTGASTDEAAYELETAVMIWNSPGENIAFPSLITEISCHNPGRLVGHAAALTARHQKLGFCRFTAVFDRAYNYERTETFHFPMARLGVDLVFDYKAEDLGLQSHFENLILVDGSWYVNWMPEGLITASRQIAAIEKAKDEARIVLYKSDHRTKTSTAQELDDERAAVVTVTDSAESLPTLQQRLDARESYRMIPKGRRDKDGYQRFSYPPMEKMLARPIHPPTVTSITVPPVLPVNEDVAAGTRSGHKTRTTGSANLHTKPQSIKYVQPLPHNGTEWRGYYGMRSLVESSNNLLKSPAHGDIENTKKRSGRGYAATFLALTFAVVTSNLKRIASFFVAEANRIETSHTKTRARRRSDEHGAPLHRAEPAPPPVTLA